jgi:hypothetical protein
MRAPAAAQQRPTDPTLNPQPPTLHPAAQVLAQDERIRAQLLMALTEDNRLHVPEVVSLLELLRQDVDPRRLVGQLIGELPAISRSLMLGWADKVLVS